MPMACAFCSALGARAVRSQRRRTFGTKTAFLSNMAVMPTGQAVTHEAVSASLRVVESAIALARAETKLAIARAEVLATEAARLVLGGLLATTFVALTLVIVTLAPLVVGHGAALRLVPGLAVPWPFLLSLTVALALAATGVKIAISALRRIRATTSEDGETP